MGTELTEIVIDANQSRDLTKGKNVFYAITI